MMQIDERDAKIASFARFWAGRATDEIVSESKSSYYSANFGASRRADDAEVDERVGKLLELCNFSMPRRREDDERKKKWHQLYIFAKYRADDDMGDVDTDDDDDDDDDRFERRRQYSMMDIPQRWGDDERERESRERTIISSFFESCRTDGRLMEERQKSRHLYDSVYSEEMMAW